MDEWVEREGDRRAGKARDHRRSGTSPVGKAPGDQRHQERRSGVESGGQSCEAERDATHVVEVEQQERAGRAVAEGIDDEPCLEQVDGARHHVLSVTVVT